MARLTTALAGAFASLCAVSLASGVIVGAADAAQPPVPSSETSLAASAPPPARAEAGSRATALGTCSVSNLAADPRLADFKATVRDAATGTILFERGGGQPAQTASVMKVLTSAAALAVLGPDYRVPTRAVKGAQPGSVVLVGGGDITLASGRSNIYPGAASMVDLAAQVRAAWAADPATAGTPIRSVVLDSSLFTGADWHPSWGWKEAVDGYSSKVTALQVDGDRANPFADTSPRSEDPIGRAGAAFVDALGVDASVSTGTAPAGAPQLGMVQSAPLSTMIPDILLRSDNTGAEMLARLVAIRIGAGSTFDSLSIAMPLALQRYGLDTTGLQVADGSGLSPENGVSSRLITALMDRIQAREQNLGIILDGLPVAGRSGTLSYRFTGGASIARGAITAKTGWIDTANALAGVIQARDGSVLTFAFQSTDSDRDPARQAIDELAAGVYLCGVNLSNF